MFGQVWGKIKWFWRKEDLVGDGHGLKLSHAQIDALWVLFYLIVASFITNLLSYYL
jgi:hypothetical protein